ncbi:MAG TPA: hypothetical protein VGK29_17485 [Paludibaculum sp.]|jgi:hypothetical protein
MSDGNENLRNALRALSLETGAAQAALRVKSNLLNEMRRRQRKTLTLKWWPAAAVAALAMGVWLGAPKLGVPAAPANTDIPTQVVEVPAEAPPVMAQVPAAVPVRTTRPANYPAPQPANQLSPLTPWYIHPGIPEARQGHMVYMDVGPETARLFGLTGTGPMKAEVYLGDDGLARAIRLVRTTQIVRGE